MTTNERLDALEESVRNLTEMVTQLLATGMRAREDGISEGLAARLQTIDTDLKWATDEAKNLRRIMNTHLSVTHKIAPASLNSPRRKGA